MMDEEARLSARAKELRRELAALPDTIHQTHRDARQRVVLASKLARVEKRLYHRRQQRLL